MIYLPAKWHLHPFTWGSLVADLGAAKNMQVSQRPSFFAFFEAFGCQIFINRVYFNKESAGGGDPKAITIWRWR